VLVSFWVVIGAGAGVWLALHVEWRRHQRTLRRIPIRVHVNGTRGKSSVTRLIAAALREHRVATVAKTTGTAARLILPDGAERPIPRDGRPNIGELTRTMHEAARLGARAVVFECMAVDPDLQRVAEERIVVPTITVVTNARLDHTDVQGASPEEIARAFAVRRRGTLVTSDPVVARIHGPRLRHGGGTVHLVSGLDVDATATPAMTYIEHPDNLAIALEVARIAGIPRDVALRGVSRAHADPGAACVIELAHPSGAWRLVNLFAANDPESTFAALEAIQAAFGDIERPVLLFAARNDRVARSSEFAAVLAHEHARFARVVVWGERTRAMLRKARRRGVPSSVIVDAGFRPPAALTELLLACMQADRTVVGVGNIIGPAQVLLDFLAETPTTDGDATRWGLQPGMVEVTP